MVMETKELKRPLMDSRTQRGPTRQLFADVVELAELQLELLKSDAREATRNVLSSLVIGVFAACLVLASVPVILAGIAHWITQSTELSLAAGLSCTGAAAALVASILGVVAYRLGCQGAKSLERSRSELQQNLAWLKSTLASKDDGSTPRNAK
ncbi:phage holin family protein [Aeoliella sp.]|uniref:phage holin family protein n=1 Tax=Aeoliella sp. TaxID=2795800 RepID=UPI003CCC2D4B